MEMSKYPRTPHLPWSEGASNDDKLLKNVDHFSGKSISISIKLDGENTTMYRNGLHARSLDSKDHPSRHWVKAYHASVRHNITKGWRVCGENLYAKHSIHYLNLPSYFMVFLIANENNLCLSTEETEYFCEQNGFTHVPVIYRGIGGPLIESFSAVEALVQGNFHEGYVVRLSDDFRLENFDVSVAKYVRKNHITTDDHWMYKEVVPNQLKDM
jgi:hypothetical protein